MFEYVRMLMSLGVRVCVFCVFRMFCVHIVCGTLIRCCRQRLYVERFPVDYYAQNSQRR